MNRILITLSLILLISFTALADSNRVLLRPPDGYEGIEIGGVPHVMGQVYLAQYADTVLLTPFGFRDFKFIGSTSRYKKIKAWWPLNTDVDALPDKVIGLSYEPMTEADLAYAAIMRPDLVPTGKSMEDIKAARYSHMFPADGKPHLIFKDQPYVEGVIFCASEPDKEYLNTLGVVLLYEFDQADSYHSHARWSAMWPMSLKASQLPYYVVGMIADSPRDYYYDEYASNNRDYAPSTTVIHRYVYGGSGYKSNYRYSRSSSPSSQNKYGNRYTREWTAERRNDPSAYWYNTLSKTTLHPTTIGAYDGNKYLQKVRKQPPSYYYRRGYHGSYRYHYHR